MRAGQSRLRPGPCSLRLPYSLPQKQYASQPAVDEFNDELIRRLQAYFPPVKSVGAYVVSASFEQQ